MRGSVRGWQEQPGAARCNRVAPDATRRSQMRPGASGGYAPDDPRGSFGQLFSIRCGNSSCRLMHPGLCNRQAQAERFDIGSRFDHWEHYDWEFQNDPRGSLHGIGTCEGRREYETDGEMFSAIETDSRLDPRGSLSPLHRSCYPQAFSWQGFPNNWPGLKSSV